MTKPLENGEGPKKKKVYRNTLLAEAAIGIDHDVSSAVLGWWRSCNQNRNNSLSRAAIINLVKVETDTFRCWLLGLHAR